MNEFIKSLEQEFSLIKSGFKEEEKRALADYKNNDRASIKKLAFLSYESKVLLIRMIRKHTKLECTVSFFSDIYQMIAKF